MFPLFDIDFIPHTDQYSLFQNKIFIRYLYMECLLPIAFSSLSMHALNPLIEISHFFKDLCSTMLKEDDLVRIEENITLILCKLEIISPHGFFIQWRIFLFILHMEQDLMHQCSIGGCIHFRTYLNFIYYTSQSSPNYLIL